MILLWYVWSSSDFINWENLDCCYTAYQNIQNSLIKSELLLWFNPSRRPMQNKEFIQYFPSSGRCSSIFRKAGFLMHNGYLGRQSPSLWMTPFLLSSSFYCWAQGQWYGISLWSVGVRCSGCAPPTSCALQPLCWQSSMRSWNVLDVVQALTGSN